MRQQYKVCSVFRSRNAVENFCSGATKAVCPLLQRRSFCREKLSGRQVRRLPRGWKRLWYVDLAVFRSFEDSSSRAKTLLLAQAQYRGVLSRQQELSAEQDSHARFGLAECLQKAAEASLQSGSTADDAVLQSAEAAAHSTACTLFQEAADLYEQVENPCTELQPRANQSQAKAHDETVAWHSDRPACSSMTPEFHQRYMYQPGGCCWCPKWTSNGGCTGESWQRTSSSGRACRRSLRSNSRPRSGCSHVSSSAQP